MGKISTNKKLELVRALRMQNHYNRQLFRAREGILYSDLPKMHREIYGLEGNLPPFPEENFLKEKDKPVAGGFRVRFVLAMVLLLCFILCDLNHVSYKGETTDSIYGRIVESPDVTELLGFTGQ